MEINIKKVQLQRILLLTGFPPIREIRDNFEDFFAVREIREKQDAFSQNQGKKFQIRELFFQNHFQTFKLRKNVF